jgi:phosphatidylserine decarboxylase
MDEQPGRYLEQPASVSDWLKTLPLYPLPHHAISRLVHRLVRVKAPFWEAGVMRDLGTLPGGS